jgi:hypothetical protein
MGFFKNLKSDRADRNEVKNAGLAAFASARAQADEMQAQHGDVLKAARGMDMNAAMANAQRLQHIKQNGLEGTATLVSATDGGPANGGFGTEIVLELNLTSGPGAPRSLTIRQVRAPGVEYTPGLETQVKIDPDNLDDAILWAAIPTGEDARLAKLEQLAAIHASGALTDEQFAALKAKTLAD